MNTNKISLILLVLLALVTSVSCGSGGGGTTPPPPDISQLDTYGFTSDGLVVRFPFGADVEVYVEPAESVDGWTSSLNSQVAKQVQVWNKVGDLWGLFHVSTTEDPSRAEVRVTWVDSLGGNTAGRTSYSASNGRLDLPELIELPTHIAGQKVSASTIGLAAVHEMGHALGLWQHSDNPGDVMYAIASVASPSKRDQNTIYKLYSTPAHITSSLKAPSKLDGGFVTVAVE